MNTHKRMDANTKLNGGQMVQFFDRSSRIETGLACITATDADKLITLRDFA